MFKELNEEVKKERERFEHTMDLIMEEARLVAIETAINETPPLAGSGHKSLRAKNSVTSSLKDSWAEDSDKHVTRLKTGWLFNLKNNRHYASYVNDGHNLKKHFVPGLFVDPNTGLLTYDEDMKDETGIVVGTKTHFVQGYNMVEKAKVAWDEYIDKQISTRLV